jgi:hypothetical protein
MGEVADTSHKQLLGLHVYFLRRNQREALFVCAKQVISAPTADTLTDIAISMLRVELAMTEDEVGCKLVAIATDGGSVMAGQHSGVMAKILALHAPEAQGIPCFGQRVNLVGAGIANIPILAKLGQLSSWVFNCFRNRYVLCRLLSVLHLARLPCLSFFVLHMLDIAFAR